MKTHGTYIIEKRDNYIFMKFIGPFNEYTAEGVYRDFKNLLDSYDVQLKIVIDLFDFDGGTPEVLKYCRKVNKLQLEHKLAGKAFIGKTKFFVNLIKHYDEQVSRQNTEYFNNLESAEHWLQNL